MKTFMKVCGICALFLLGGGIVLAIAGCSIAGTDQISRVVQEVTDGKMNVDLDALDGQFGIFVENALDGIRDGEEFNIDDYGSVYADAYPVVSGDVSKYALEDQDIREIYVNAGACHLQVKKSENDLFSIEAVNASRLQVYVEGGALYVNTSRSGKVSGSMIKSSVVTIYVPEQSSLEAAELEMGAGLMEVEELIAHRTGVTVGAGQIVIGSLLADRADLHVGMGDITVTGMDVEDLTAEVGMGNLDLNGSVRGECDLECSMGNLTLGLSNQETEFSYYVECAMGRIDLNGREYSGLAAAKEILHEGGRRMKLNCSMGNIDILFRGADR